MTDWSSLRCCIGAGLVLVAGCFDGRDALGLPCEEDFQCGNGQVCTDGTCVWPGDAAGTGTGTGTEGTGTAGPGTEGTGTEGTGPTPTCIEDGVLRRREINIDDSGNPMSVGVGRFSDQHDADIVVLTRSPGRLSVFRFDGVGFSLVNAGDVDDDAMDIAVGSLDGDDYDDVVLVDGSDLNQARVTLFWGAAGGLFVEPQTSFDEALAFPHSVAIGRMLESSDQPQFIVSSGTDASASYLFLVNNRQPERRATYSDVSPSPWDTVVVDLDGEPPLEALVAGSNDAGTDLPGSDVVHVLSAADGGLTQLQRLEAAHSPFGVDAGDLTGDGTPEVIVVGKNIDMPAGVPEESDNPSEISICARDSPRDNLVCDTWMPGPEHTGYSNVRLADLDCDGHLDAVIGTTGGTSLDDGVLLLALGPLATGFVPMVLGTTGPIGNKIAIADVTGDGAPDIVVPRYGAEGSGQGLVSVYSFEEPTP